MTKKTKKLQRNTDKKEATMKVLSSIAKVFLNSEDKKALEIGESMIQIRKNLGELPPELFAELGNKFEKKMNEIVPPNTDDVLARLEKLANQLEAQQSKQIPSASGLSGVHNTVKLDHLNSEVQQVKEASDEMQVLQQQLQQSMNQVEALNKAVQATLQETKQQADAIALKSTDHAAKSDAILQKFNTEMANVAQGFTNTMHNTTQLFQQLEQKVASVQQLAQHTGAENKTAFIGLEKQVEESLQALTSATSRRFDAFNEQFEDLDDSMDKLKKTLNASIVGVQGNIAGLEDELAQVKEVASFLQQKASESLQLVHATEDEAYVQEAASLLNVLVERLVVGASLYAKHRETIEAIEANEAAEQAWQVEKQRLLGANAQLATLTEQAKVQEQQIGELKDAVQLEVKRGKNLADLKRYDIYQEMAAHYPIEQWPAPLRESMFGNGVSVHPQFKAGEEITVDGTTAGMFEKFIDLATHQGKLQLTTSCYLGGPSKKVIQRAKSKLVTLESEAGTR